MTDTDDDHEATGLEMLADYECPEHGQLVEDPNDPTAGYGFTEREADEILGGDDCGVLRCPLDCGEELELTHEATMANLEMVVRRHPEMGPDIAAKLTAALTDL